MYFYEVNELFIAWDTKTCLQTTFDSVALNLLFGQVWLQTPFEVIYFYSHITILTCLQGTFSNIKI